jgi:hypothetical protein
MQIFYTNPDTKVTSLYNMIFSNATVAYYAAVYNETQGLSPDDKPSVILDYHASELVYIRPFKDELRQVGSQVRAMR